MVVGVGVGGVVGLLPRPRVVGCLLRRVFWVFFFVFFGLVFVILDWLAG
jgi:hypothetical protein